MTRDWAFELSYTFIKLTMMRWVMGGVAEESFKMKQTCTAQINSME